MLEDVMFNLFILKKENIEENYFFTTFSAIKFCFVIF